MGEWRANRRPAAESSDRHAGRHTPPIWKPFDERGDRRNVAQPESDPSQATKAQPDDPELMQVDAERRQHESAAPAERCNETRLSRTRTLQPSAEQRRRQAEHHDADR